MSTAWAQRAPNEATLGQRFEDLFLPHLNAAYSLARFIARDPVAADDIVQESFLRAFRSFAKYRGGDAKAWLLTIVRNCSFDWSRSRSAVPGGAPGGAPAPDPDELPGELEGPEESAVRRNEIEEVRAMVRSLPEPFRETLILRELQELSYGEIASITRVPVGTVMSRLARARRMLTEAAGQTP